MKLKYKLIIVLMCVITLFCFNAPVYAASGDTQHIVYSPWQFLNTQSNYTELPQLFHINYSTGNRVSFQGNSSSGLLPSQSGLVTTIYKPGDIYDQTTGLWSDSIPGMTLNSPEPFIDVIDASQIGINMFYNNGTLPNFMSPPLGGHIAYKMDVLFRWIYDKGEDPNQSLLQFNNVYLFGYTKADRSSFDTFNLADVPYDWTSGEYDRYTNFYQRIYHFEFVMPINVTKIYYGFMFKVVGRFKSNYLHSYVIGMGDLQCSKVTYVLGGVSSADDTLSSITNGVDDRVYSQISPLTNTSYFNIISNGSLLARSIINRFSNLPWLNYMLIFSLAVGVVGFLFSFTGKVHR